MAGLTAKVFRTYNASYTMSNLLQNLDPKQHKNLTVNEKVKLYNDCNREVAILCNHKRTVGASHEQAMEKLGDRVSLRCDDFRASEMFANGEPHRSKASSTRDGGRR